MRGGDIKREIRQDKIKRKEQAINYIFYGLKV